MTNIILNTDSYKTSHFLQYPPGTTNVCSYIEARTGGRTDETVFFGLQAFLKEYLTTPITQEDIEEAEEIITAHGLPFNREGWEYILDVHNGYLPLKIEALPEGSVTPTGIPLVQVKATDPRAFWLVSYIETALLRAVWYGTTVATYSRDVKKVLRGFLMDTADDLSALPFMLHDFGARGTSSYESSLVGGAAHLVNFMGTDTLASIKAVRDWYYEDIAGFSVPAAEHSTITSWGRDREIDAYRNMIDMFDKDGGITSIVSDSYDLWHAIDNIYGGELKDRIQSMKGRLVVRPDSGDPETVVLQTVQKLADAFGYSTNSRGYKVLPANIRVLQGDGVNIKKIELILDNLQCHDWSAENVVFGMGGCLLQEHTRDELRFAMKANAVCDAWGNWEDVYKAPTTDLSKSSKAGQQVVTVDAIGIWKSEKLTLGNHEANNQLQTVFFDGHVVRQQDFTDIRRRAEI